MAQDSVKCAEQAEGAGRKDFKSLVARKIVQMKKGSLELAILSLLSRAECYGYDLCQQLKQSGVETVAGTVYPLLNRLKKEGIIGYSWKESIQGPPRKYYVLTEMGRDMYQEMKNEWNILRNGLQQIFELDTAGKG